MPWRALLLALCLSLAIENALSADEAAPPFVVFPAEITLRGNFDRSQLLVAGTNKRGETDDRSPDQTHRATYVSSDPAIAGVSQTGQVCAIGNGTATITIAVEGASRQIKVQVEGVVPQPEIGFSQFVAPILSKAGCNAGACHASQHGKGGFKLSVFGFAPEDDYAQIVRDRQGRRIDKLSPENSLILQKPSLVVPHGGNRRLEVGSAAYNVLAAWIACGAPGPDAKAPKVASLAVLPKQRVGEIGLSQQLRVMATMSDGSQRDVTCWAKYDSMDEALLQVTPQGRVSVIGRGQAPVMVRYEGQAAVATFVSPFAKSVELAGWTNNNFVDELAARKFRELGIEPSPLCDDATFLRRAYLDAVGTLPTKEQTLAFLDDATPDKRQRLVDELLGLAGDPSRDVHNNDYAAFWSLKWSDLIRNTSAKLGEQGMWALHNWIKDSMRANKPFDQFVRELIAAKGSIYMNGPANYYRIASDPNELAEATAQLFLGVRLQCAQCHHHPFEKYSQDDYYGFAAFFSRVGTKNSQEFGLFGRETVVLVKSAGEVRHPRGGKVMAPAPLDGPIQDNPLDRRLPLADWLVSKDNGYFSRNVVNRYMAYLLGAGLVEPVDDLRATNPPSNVALMDALAAEFADSGYDLKRLLRTIMSSRLYQLDSQPTPANAADSRFYSHYQVKRLGAEPLLDALDFATGSQTKFKNLPLGAKAIELPDGEYPTYSLAVFGKPRRASTCECERTSDPSLTAALHILNSDVLTSKLGDKQGRLANLLAAKTPHDQLVEELYLVTLCRRPSAAEQAHWRKTEAVTADKQAFYEDLLWALLNSKSFVFNR